MRPYATEIAEDTEMKRKPNVFSVHHAACPQKANNHDNRLFSLCELCVL